MTSNQRSVLAVALLTQGVGVGLTYGIFPVFLEPLESAFAAPRTQISSGQILMMLALTIGSITTGILLDRGYVRRVMLTGAIMIVLALLIASSAPNLWVLGLAAVMGGMAVPAVGPLAAASLITRAFEADRGRALGLMSMGPPLGAGIFAALAGWLLVSLDWRETYMLFAGVALVGLVPIILLVVPARFESSPEVAKGGPDSAAAVGGVGALLRTPTFWWSAAVFALATGIASGWTVHVAAFLVGLGLDETESSSLLAVQFWMGVPGALVFGMLADRVSLTTLFVVMLATASAVFVGFAAGPSPWVVSGLCVLSGFTLGGVIPLYMMLLGKRMGPDVLGRAMGLSNLVMLPVMAGAVLLAASNYEARGGYGMALSIFSIGFLLAIGCLLMSNRSTRTR
jgi:predicted MFS family arabinose efflux permease